MQRPDGAELAVITRRGPGGHVEDALEIELTWQRPHEQLSVLDPFAAGGGIELQIIANTGVKTNISLAGYQDVILVLAR